MMPGLHKKVLVAVIGGVILGWFLTAFIFYPPHVGWSSELKIGDLATWFAAAGTAFATVVALVIAGGDRRRRDKERVDDQDIVDFRTAILVQPAFITLKAVAAEVRRLLDNAEKSGKHLYLTSGINTPIEVDGPAYDLRVLNLSLFETIGRMDSSVGTVSKGVGTPILCAIAWSRQSLFVLQSALIEIQLSEGELGNMYQIDPGVMPGVMTTLGFLIGYIKQAEKMIASIVGRASELPEEIVHPKVRMGNGSQKS